MVLPLLRKPLLYKDARGVLLVVGFVLVRVILAAMFRTRRLDTTFSPFKSTIRSYISAYRSSNSDGIEDNEERGKSESIGLVYYFL